VVPVAHSCKQTHGIEPDGVALASPFQPAPEPSYLHESMDSSREHGPMSSSSSHRMSLGLSHSGTFAQWLSGSQHEANPELGTSESPPVGTVALIGGDGVHLLNTSAHQQVQQVSNSVSNRQASNSASRQQLQQHEAFVHDVHEGSVGEPLQPQRGRTSPVQLNKAWMHQQAEAPAGYPMLQSGWRLGAQPSSSTAGSLQLPPKLQTNSSSTSSGAPRKPVMTPRPLPTDRTRTNLQAPTQPPSLASPVPTYSASPSGSSRGGSLLIASRAVAGSSTAPPLPQRSPTQPSYRRASPQPGHTANNQVPGVQPLQSQGGIAFQGQPTPQQPFLWNSTPPSPTQRTRFSPRPASSFQASANRPMMHSGGYVTHR